MSKNSAEETARLLNPAADAVLKYTPIKDIAPIVQRLRDGFNTHKTHPLQFRLNQLRNLYFAIKDNADALCDALFLDFKRSKIETRTLEVIGSLNDILHTMAHLEKWAQPDEVEHLPLSMRGTPVFVEKVPLGVVLIIAPFNYPLLLSVSPLVGAIAGGNAVVLKQTELTTHFTALLSEILTKALDPSVFATIDGAIPETNEVLEQKFDKIVYTGSTIVGKIIAKKAAETLTPVLLELGGKSPAFVLPDLSESELKAAASRIAWGRFTNGGQTCVAVDYVLVHESKKAKFLENIKEIIEERFYKNIDKSTDYYTHLVHDRAYNNISAIIDKSKGTLVTGGKHRDAKTRFIAPTIISDVDFDDSTMAQEIFGPVLPVISYTNLKDAVAKVTKFHDTPLAQYIFTSDMERSTNKEIDTILTNVRSGAVIINDVLIHVSLTNAPFGGIGQSGQGSYHGKYSFRAFTHERTTLKIAFWKEKIMSARYPPQSKPKENLIKSSQSSFGNKIWFDRTGDVQLKGPSYTWSFYSSIVGAAAIGYCLFAAS